MVAARFCIFLYFLPSSSGTVDDLPPYFPHCNRLDPKLSECLINATETVRPFLVKGVAELGIPSFDPHLIPEININQGSQALNFKALLKNIIVRGLTTYKFTQFDFDVPNLHFLCKFNIPKVELDGESLITGKILVASIEGKGKFSASVENINITMDIKLETRTIKGVKFLRISQTNTSVVVDKPNVKLEGLFGGDEQLTSITNTAISENSDEVFKELKPAIEQIITQVLEELLFKAITHNVPLHKLFPTSE